MDHIFLFYTNLLLYICIVILLKLNIYKSILTYFDFSDIHIGLSKDNKSQKRRESDESVK